MKLNELARAFVSSFGERARDPEKLTTEKMREEYDRLTAKKKLNKGNEKDLVQHFEPKISPKLDLLIKDRVAQIKEIESNKQVKTPARETDRGKNVRHFSRSDAIFSAKFTELHAPEDEDASFRP